MKNFQLKWPFLMTMMGFLSTIILSISLSYAEGGLSLSQTRVIFEGTEKSAKVTLNNQSDRVYLVNSRVLPTPNMGRQFTEMVPFMVTPPLFRLEKESTNTVLISKNNTSTLPTDRESVFYLSFLAIPAVKNNSEEAVDENMTTTQVSFGIRTVIKLFYRPIGLSIPAAQAPEQLTFSLHKTQLTVSNPTPYHVTLAQLTSNGENVNVREQGAMVAPFSSQSYQIKESTQTNIITWSVINDFGGVSDLFHWPR